MSTKDKVDFEEQFRERFGVDESVSTEEAFDLIEQYLHRPPDSLTITWGPTGSPSIMSSFNLNNIEELESLIKRLRIIMSNLEELLLSQVRSSLGSPKGGE